MQDFLRYPSALKEVHLVSFNEETHRAFTKVFLDVSANDFHNSRDPPPTTRPLSASLRLTDERQEERAPVDMWKMEKPNHDTRDLKKYFTDPMSNTDDDDCIICLRPFINPVSLKSCHHIFCEECISEFFSQKPVCPICNTMYGKIYGDQPKNGTATIFKEKTQLSGEDCKDAWVIMYEFPDGKQEVIQKKFLVITYRAYRLIQTHFISNVNDTLSITGVPPKSWKSLQGYPANGLFTR